MKLSPVAVIVVLSLFPLASIAAQAQHQPSTPDRPRMVGYLPEWMIYSGYYPKNLAANGSAKQLTHILYAFSNLPAPGSPGADWPCQAGRD